MPPRHNSHDKTLAKLDAISPSQLLIPNTIQYSADGSQLYAALEATFVEGSETSSNTRIVPVNRKHFNDRIGREILRRTCIAHLLHSLEILVDCKYYCLAALAALVHHAEDSLKFYFTPRSLRYRFSCLEDTTLIDMVTSRNLELTSRVRGPADNSLFGTLNRCRLRAGSRLLRANILQPPTDAALIRRRLQCVNDVMQCDELYFKLQTVLTKFIDIDKIIVFLVQVMCAKFLC